MKEWITENIIALISTLFGGTSIYAFITERNKRKIEEKQIGGDALKTMQDAYDKFTLDSLKRYEDLSADVDGLKKKLINVTLQLEGEENKYVVLKLSYEKLKDSYDKLKKEFDNYRLKTK